MFQSVCQKKSCDMSLSSSLLTRVQIPPCVERRIARWIGCPSGRNGTRKVTFVCENVLSFYYFQTVVIPQGSKSLRFSSKQCKSKPCLRVDTVLTQAVPKEIFPHRAGSTQIFSRCFCMNDDGTTLLPSRRITYYEKSDYQ